MSHVPYITHAFVSGNGSMRGHAGLHCAHKCYNFFSWYYTVQFRHTTHVHSPLWMHERKLHPHLWRLSRQIFEIDKVITCTTTLFEALIRGNWWQWSTGKRSAVCPKFKLPIVNHRFVDFTKIQLWENHMPWNFACLSNNFEGHILIS